MATSTTVPRTFRPSARDTLQEQQGDPYASTRDSTSVEEKTPSAVMTPTNRKPYKESWEQKEMVGYATSILDDPDMLLMYAQARGDSVASQRLHFIRMLCGEEGSESRSAAAQTPKARTPGRR